MKIIIEVGSTNTKIDLFDGKEVKHLATENIEFKRNYKKENRLDTKDVQKLIEVVKEYTQKYNNVYVCGTSIFRNLNDEQKTDFLNKFYNETGVNFDIISPEKENELTVFGTVRNVNQKVAVFIGGGGSTEIAIYDGKIKETVNTAIGVMDIMNHFPDLANDIASTELEVVREVIKSKLNLPKEKADILILAGGGHKHFALNSGIRYEKNTLFDDALLPIMMDIKTRNQDTLDYYKKISLDEIRNRVDDPNWWYATRAMCAFVLNVAEAIDAKYIVPTDISMVYGLLNTREN